MKYLSKIITFIKILCAAIFYITAVGQNVYASQQFSVGKYNVGVTFLALASIRSFGTDRSDNVYFTRSGQLSDVWKITPNGTTSVFLSGITDARYVATYYDGIKEYLYVASGVTTNGKLVKINLTDSITADYVSPVDIAHSVAVTPYGTANAGQVYMTYYPGTFSLSSVSSDGSTITDLITGATLYEAHLLK